MNEKANYGNWVPEKALYMLFGAVIVLGRSADLRAPWPSGNQLRSEDS